ncbi:helix-turn-helix domain-containing protein [Bosea sp. 2YAB26]|uniref:helix-turn-helix domain-containing protein n=1 Tax=Bosea sp. 2YAB26 TaxID=3237478 RepID=UPI003F9143D7
MTLARRPNSIDRDVGSRLRARRQLIGLSQSQLAEQLGITFQQVQKYESGSNRLSASRLQLIANILEVPVGYFFEAAAIESIAPLERLREDRAADIADLLSTSEGIRLVKAFLKAESTAKRQRIVAMVEGMVNADPAGSSDEIGPSQG